MQDILNQYILFIIKAITLIIFGVFFIMIIFSKKTLDIFVLENINKKFQKMSLRLNKSFEQQNFFQKIKNLFINNKKKILFIINFDGDINASETELLKDIISILIVNLNKNDEVLLILNSSGGFINQYGLAAAQLKRLKKFGIKLTISIDKIAASGGYLMASVADKIIASEFAIIGSIGVIGIMPNFNSLLKKNDINIEYHTAGEYKTTLNMFTENTDKGREKFIESLNKTHDLFKEFISTHRKEVNIEKVSTGEYWYGKDALKLNLIDKIETSDEYIIEKLNEYTIYKISTIKNKNFFYNLVMLIKNKFL
jgi:serine protease SohB